MLAYEPENPIVIHGVPQDPERVVRVSIDVVEEGMYHVKVPDPVDDCFEVGELLNTPIPWPRHCVRLCHEAQKVIIFLSLDYSRV